MEENVNTQQTQQQPVQQPAQEPVQPAPEEKSKGLMWGQEREDELDAMGALLFAAVRNSFGWIKNLFVPKKVE